MRRGFFILSLGLIGAALAFAGSFWMGTLKARSMRESGQPELAWLKQEFKLGDAEFQRVVDLHAGYLPGCMERCRRINQLNQALTAAVDTSMQVTPDTKKILAERAQLRADCQAEMLEHFLAVSRTMPPGEGRRYLDWVLASTCLREQPMAHGHGAHAAPELPGR